MNNKSTGNEAEKAAAGYLRQKGYKILERNYSTVIGEIDIVALDGDVLCFIEVRSRSSKDYGGALQALSRKKQRRVTRAALAYIKAKRLEEVEMRFDFAAVEVCPDGATSIELIKNAFWPGEVRSGR
jgi:putative endonuclease